MNVIEMRGQASAEQVACDARLLVDQITECCGKIADRSDVVGAELAMRCQLFAELASNMLRRIEQGDVT